MKYRFVDYGLISFLVVVVPSLPLPFPKPQLLHDIYGELGILLFIGWLVICIFWLSGLLILLVIALIKRRHLLRKALIEVIGFSAIMTAALVLPAALNTVEPARYIAELNASRAPEQFVNPFLTYKMIDCRNLTEKFDVIFVPSFLGMETDYLAYAPRRADKSTGGYKHAKKYGDDWYWETTGSQWNDDFRKCYRQRIS